MLGEDGLRSLSTTGACTVIICAGACHLARQYWSGTSVNRRQEECALHTSKRRFVERMWSLVTQDTDTENDLVKDFGPADHQGVYTSTSALENQTIYLRRAPSSGALGGFEWSVEKLVWLPTSSILDGVLSIDHEILIRRLEAELLLTSSRISMAQTGAPITHPPELDLPQSLKAPENIRGDVRVPQEYRCPLGSGVMSQPVVAPSGLTYDRAVIEQWVARFHTDPATGAPLQISQLYPNLIIRDLIQAWIVSNAHKLDPTLVERVTRECTPASFLATPVSDCAPLAFDRTSSFGLGSERASSVVLDAVSVYGPAAAAGASRRGSAPHFSTEQAEPHHTKHAAAPHSPQSHPTAQVGHCDHTPHTSETHTPVASLKQRRHSSASALSGHSIASDSLIPAGSQQECSPMASAGFMCPSRHNTYAAGVHGKRVSSSNSLPAMRCQSGEASEEATALSLSTASPLCCGGTADAANMNAIDTGRDTESSHHTSERTPDSLVLAGNMTCQQRLLPVKLTASAGPGLTPSSLQCDVADDRTGSERLLEAGGTAVVSPGSQAPRKWDSDEMLRAATGGVQLSRDGIGQVIHPPAAAALQGSTDKTDQEDLDRLIA